MNIPAGRIIWTDMTTSKWGRVLYIVMNAPIVCEHCGSVVYEWRSSDEQIECPCCGNIILHRDCAPCPHCGGNDYHTLRVVNNDNFYYDPMADYVNEYNNRRGSVIDDCGKNLEAAFKSKKMVLYDAKRSQDTKRLIAWNASDEFDPTKPMPQEIIDAFPYDAQE